MPSPYSPHDTSSHYQSPVSDIPLPQKRNTYPTNFSAVTAGPLLPTPLTSSVRIVKNSHLALSPSGVPSAAHVRSVIVPSDPPVASTPICEYSRS